MCVQKTMVRFCYNQQIVGFCLLTIDFFLLRTPEYYIFSLYNIMIISYFIVILKRTVRWTTRDVVLKWTVQHIILFK